MPGIYQLVLTGEVLTQETKNIWHYQSVTGSPVASDLASQWLLTVLPSIENISSSEMVYKEVSVTNIATGTDYFTATFTLSGARSGLCTSPFNAWGFILNPGNTTVKAGGKRFAGVANGDLDDGDPSGPIVSLLATCALRIGQAVVTGAGNFRPVLVSVRCNKSGTPLRCNGTFQTPTYPQINSGTFDVSTTQSSRKWRTA